jgi:hypothetical protein
MTSILATRPQPLTAHRRALLAARAAADDERFGPVKHLPAKPGKHYTRRVVRINPDGSETTFNSIKDAAASVQTWPNGITTACNEGERCRGYRWRWA